MSLEKKIALYEEIFHCQDVVLAGRLFLSKREYTLGGLGSHGT